MIGIDQGGSQRKIASMQDPTTSLMDNLKGADIHSSFNCLENARLGSEPADCWKPRNFGYVRLKTTSCLFITDPSSWLGHSTFFEALFAGKSVSALDDGSFFIDCEGQLFRHILQYLRTGVLPLFYDPTKGHDFAQYHALLGEAEYFGIDRLCKWLLSRRYLDAVNIRHVSATALDLNPHTQCDANGGPSTYKHRRFSEVSTDDHTKILPMPMIQQQSFCRHPTGIHSINPRGDYCHCSNDGTNKGGRIKEDAKCSITWREIVFDHDLCVNAFPDDMDRTASFI